MATLPSPDHALRRIGGKAWRVVEAQHVVSTRKLVDSREDHELLEAMIETAKPADPAGDGDLHYLLSTPFRYPPLRHGSRFGRRTGRSLWYGSVRPRTAFAEAAYYRLLFLEGTTADLGSVETDLSLFSVRVRTSRGVDLNREPYAAHRETLTARDSHAATQQLGAEMREAGVEAFRFPSARDRKGGVNWGLFTPRAFAERKPGVPETWHCVASRAGVELTKRDFFERRGLAFPREEFEVEGRLPVADGGGN